MEWEKAYRQACNIIEKKHRDENGFYLPGSVGKVWAEKFEVGLMPVIEINKWIIANK